MLDASLITYFPQSDGKPAGVEELAAGIMKWYGENPDFKGNEKKLGAFMRNKGWKNGPAVLANVYLENVNLCWPERIEITLF